MKPDEFHASRRRFLRDTLGLGAAVVAAGACQPEPSAQAAKVPPSPPAPPAAPPASTLPQGLDPSLFVMHTRSPLTLEAKRSSMGSGVITPMSRFFVRNNLPMPDASITVAPDAWEVALAGVKNPRTLSVAMLKQLGWETVATVLQCSGNGRQFYGHGPSGSQWATGAAGCAMWTGVPLRRVVESLGGLADGVRFLTSTGGEALPDGVDRDDVIVERSIPVDKALDDVLLAWEMNGEPIPITHGGPLRLIVPGYFGCNQIKYVRKVAFTAAQTTAKIQRSGYRYRPIGEKGSTDQPSLWAMKVKSWVNGPGADDQPVLAGNVAFHGVAFASGEPIEQVECSVDGGVTWKPARLVGPDLGPYAWRQFVFPAELAPGQRTVHSRARTTKGAVQPELRDENERGYAHNGWRDHGLTVSVVAELPDVASAPVQAAPEPPQPAAPARAVELDDRGERGKQALLAEASPPCGSCHTLGDAEIQGVVGPNLDELAPDAARVQAALNNGVGVMPSYKDRLADSAIQDIAHYVEQATKR